MAIVSTSTIQRGKSEILSYRCPSSVRLAGSEEPSSLPASPRGKPRGCELCTVTAQRTALACQLAGGFYPPLRLAILIPPIEPCNLAAFVIIGGIGAGSADWLVIAEGVADVGNELLQEVCIAVLLGIDVHGQLHTAADYLIHALRVAALQPDDDGVLIHIANKKIRFGKGAHYLPAFKIDAACFRFAAG